MNQSVKSVLFFAILAFACTYVYAEEVCMTYDTPDECTVFVINRDALSTDYDQPNDGDTYCEEEASLHCSDSTCCSEQGGLMASTYQVWGGFHFSFSSEEITYECENALKNLSCTICGSDQSQYLKNGQFQVCKYLCDEAFDSCGLPGLYLADTYTYTDGASLCNNTWAYSDDNPAYPTVIVVDSTEDCAGGFKTTEPEVSSSVSGNDDDDDDDDDSPASLSTPTSAFITIATFISMALALLF